jgi:hypothetical protein
MLDATNGLTTVAILGENPVVGKALETLLLSSDLGARFFIDYPAGSAERLDGARVALILPTSSTVRGKALMERIKSSPATADLQIIELITTPDEERNGHIRLPWPCSLQELKRSIEAALPKNPGSEPAD